MARIAIDIPKNELRDFCRKWKITEFSLFGSARPHRRPLTRDGVERSLNRFRRESILESAVLLDVA